MSNCPTDDVLNRLLADQLTALETDTLASHVGDCVRCQEKLARLTEEEGKQLGLNRPHQPETTTWGVSALSATSDEREAFRCGGF